MSKLVRIEEISVATGFSEAEIMELVERRQIPFLKFEDKGLLFPLEEVMAMGIKKASKATAESEPAGPPAGPPPIPKKSRK